MFCKRSFSLSNCQPWIKSILLAAIINGTLLALRISIDSIVCGLKPSVISTIKMAMSAKEPPRFLREVKAAWPGVSMARSPGTLSLPLKALSKGPQIFLIVSIGIIETPTA